MRTKKITIAFALIMSVNTVLANGVDYLDKDTVLTSYPDQISITVQGDIAEQVAERLAISGKSNNVLNKDIKTTASIHCTQRQDNSKKKVCEIFWNDR